MNMGMNVGMQMFMTIHHFPILMLMGVLQADSITDHQNGCSNHDGETQIKLYRRPFVQHQHTEVSRTVNIVNPCDISRYSEAMAKNNMGNI